MSRLLRASVAVILSGSMATMAQTPAASNVAQLQQQLEQLRQTVLDQQITLTQQQRDIQTLNGDKEVLLHRLEQVQQQQQDIYLDLDQRLRDLQARSSTASVPATIPDTTAPAAEPASPSVSSVAPAPDPLPEPSPIRFDSSLSEKELYDAAFQTLQKGQYTEAVSGFQQLLNQHPNGRYADNAQYWIGESYYAMRDFNAALRAFNNLLDAYPSSNKRPHAQLKIGYVYYEMQDWAAARALLEQVVRSYPGTTTARLAEERLQALRQRGY